MIFALFPHSATYRYSSSGMIFSVHQCLKVILILLQDTIGRVLSPSSREDFFLRRPLAEYPSDETCARAAHGRNTRHREFTAVFVPFEHGVFNGVFLARETALRVKVHLKPPEHLGLVVHYREGEFVQRRVPCFQRRDVDLLSVVVRHLFRSEREGGVARDDGAADDVVHVQPPCPLHSLSLADMMNADDRALSRVGQPHQLREKRLHSLHVRFIAGDERHERVEHHHVRLFVRDDGTYVVKALSVVQVERDPRLREFRPAVENEVLVVVRPRRRPLPVVHRVERQFSNEVHRLAAGSVGHHAVKYLAAHRQVRAGLLHEKSLAGALRSGDDGDAAAREDTSYHLGLAPALRLYRAPQRTEVFPRPLRRLGNRFLFLAGLGVHRPGGLGGLPAVAEYLLALLKPPLDVNIVPVVLFRAPLRQGHHRETSLARLDGGAAPCLVEVGTHQNVLGGVLAPEFLRHGNKPRRAE